MHPFTRNQLSLCIGLGLCAPFIALAASTNSNKQAERVETVLVLGEQIKQQLKAEQASTPGGVTVIDSAELEQRNVSNLGDMLRYVPGVWTASGSTGDSTFFPVAVLILMQPITMVMALNCCKMACR